MISEWFQLYDFFSDVIGTMLQQGNDIKPLSPITEGPIFSNIYASGIISGKIRSWLVNQKDHSLINSRRNYSCVLNLVIQAFKKFILQLSPTTPYLQKVWKVSLTITFYSFINSLINYNLLELHLHAHCESRSCIHMFT